ncbi:hypothetical protein [Microbacterium sp. ZW T5_56]|uniref:hypothetical protein n=1 Tax=Microbacterium sp. ZW T5_56 TaxID=3378081 RepID=UPI003854381D
MPTLRPALALSILACAMLALAGCDGRDASTLATPVPTPSYHASASDTASADADIAEATAALDAYTEASNGIDWSDEASLERFYALSTGKQNEVDRRTYGELFDAGWHLEGEARFTVVDAEPGDGAGQVLLAVCSSTDGVRFLDASGVQQVRASSSPVAERTAVASRGQDGVWRIADMTVRVSPPKC